MKMLHNAEFKLNFSLKHKATCVKYEI